MEQPIARHMNLEDLRLFTAVARHGSFTAAGRQLGLPKGTVSRRVAGFAAAHPRVTVQCSHYVGSGLVDPGDFDLTLLAYEWQLPPSDWIARPLMSLRQGIFAAPGVSPSRSLSMPALSALPAVVAIDETFWRFRDGEGVQAVAVSGAVQLDNPTMRLRAAEHGAGLLRAPAALTEAAVRARRLVELTPALPPVALSVAMLYRSRTMPAKVRAFMDHLQSAPMLRSVAAGG